MLSANIIFPALSAAYVVPFFFPVIVLLTLFVEYVAIHWIERSARPRLLSATIAGANAWSWIVGLVLTGSGLFPSGLTVEDGRLRHGPHYTMFAYASYPLAWALSSILEFTVIYPLRRRVRIARPFRAALLANTCSYLAIGAVLLVLDALTR